MDQIDKIIKSLNFAGEISSKLSVSDSILQMTQAQQIWINDTTSISKALLKSISYNHNFLAKNIAGLNSMNLGSNLASLNISHDIISSIKEISKLQSSMFIDLKGISKIGDYHLPYLSQIKSMQMAMLGVSNQITAHAAQTNNWGLLEEFKDINEKTLELTSSISSECILTDEENQKFQQLLDAVLVFIKANNKLGKKAFNFLNLVVLIFNFYQIYDTFKDKPKVVNKEDIIKFEKKLLQAIELKFKEHNEYRTTNRITQVMLKPKTKTIILNKLPKGYDVVVLQVSHKWVYISYTNPKDNLLETGWILKKYLNKIK